MRDRAEILSLLAALPAAEEAGPDEAMQLVSERKLHRKGLGWIDVHLPASSRSSGCTLGIHRAALDVQLGHLLARAPDEGDPASVVGLSATRRILLG